MSEFSRGYQRIEASFANGTKTEVRHCLKYGVGMMYWYFIQLPCKGWVHFDIRSLQEEIPKDCILTDKSLPFVADLFKTKDWQYFKKIGY
ncbi:hypothetical protein [Runella sp.]|uniref:hypothetical protein n=1 Tax=Runella sp. TaxID=1960881 RepID=UPI003D12C911